jgi:hypothetical protein
LIRLDAATFLLQWATGGLLFLWVTTRGRIAGLGYGWLLRAVYAVMAIAAVAAARAAHDTLPARDLAALATAAATAAALVVSIVRRRAGVSGQREQRERRAARVAAMVGDPHDRSTDNALSTVAPRSNEFPPVLDLLTPAFGIIGLIAAAAHSGGPAPLAIVRTLVGAAFLGAVTDAMLLGHWYLVQPGLARGPLNELVRWVAILWPLEVAALLWPTGMASVWSGAIDDGYGGLLGWFWAACAATTMILVLVTMAALRERAYAAVMAATGLLYLAILTAFGTDLVARAVLAG